MLEEFQSEFKEEESNRQLQHSTDLQEGCTQTWFEAERSTQTVFSRDQASSVTPADFAGPVSDTGGMISWRQEVIPLRKEIDQAHATQELQRTRLTELREEAAATAREAQLMREEVLAAGAAPLASTSLLGLR
eukprot:CAMPEP_0180821062 /NCGR_PEP_ID=MMETSP1038_2-20121128/70632_1 /TAXON_ID=632150 /ORGANISM="Azadinium spinosum, Strain 3D9" /LENGTH=132 /DNA_ID=CAMNT_0022863223 /DNA_START=117 /DNA_END=511 /DNA_ORIENTATION=-